MLELRLDHQTVLLPEGTTIAQFAAMQPNQSELAGGILNGKVHDLNYSMKTGGDFEWVRLDSLIGQMMCERTLCFLLISAVHRLLNTDVLIEHSFSSGLYGTLIRSESVHAEELERVRKEMERMIADKEPILRRVVSKAEAVAHFEQLGMTDKADLLRQRTAEHCSIYSCAGVDDYFYGVMLPDASWIERFSLKLYQRGFWLSLQDEWLDQPKLFEVFRQFEQRGKETGISMISQLNDQIRSGRLPQIIEANENRIQTDLEKLAERIVSEPELKLVLIAGPSSAGKTTFCRRLAGALRERGRETLPLSLDDFFLNREESPRLPDGSYDYENVECLDLKLFHQTVESLIRAEPVILPTYDFKAGVKRFEKEPIRMHSDQIILLEGLHALNPLISKNLEESSKFRIYLNALTHLNLDRHNRITTTDYRLIRRMTRDIQFRGRSVQDTLNGWEQVKVGEDRWIYPFQEQADVLFNTSMDYELPILKTLLMPLLDAVPVHTKEYVEANRIRKLLAYFDSADPQQVPEDSILAEFTGGSCFAD